jgi:hypothetical protein
MKVSIYKNGKEIGTTAAENVKVEIINEPIRAGNNMIVATYTKSKTIYVNVEDVVFNGQDIKLSPFDKIEFRAYRFDLPKGVRKPKKKRILNKYKKKYTNTYIWEYCQIRF